MLEQTPDLSIIIINWNSQAFVRECVASISANAESLSIETVVVDNASYDGCEQMLRSHYPDVVFIQSERNLGFAKANNLAFARSTGRDVLFLNPDTEVQRDALQNLLKALHSSPKTGMVGARLVNSDRSVQDNCITALPTILNQALNCNNLRNKFPRSHLWGKQALFSTAPAAPTVEAISGACMLSRRDTIEAVKGFNPDYFMYAEDMDLCARIADAGWTIAYAADATIVHHAGSSSAARQESDFSSIMMRESLLLYFSLHRGAFYSHLYRFSSTFASIIRLLLLLVLLAAATTSTKRDSIFAKMRKWRNILTWSLGWKKCAAVDSPAAAKDTSSPSSSRLSKAPQL
jgi:N-acetylglucosaminyl-diphospho-decaprenol L-rhamnosyltransferase